MGKRLVAVVLLGVSLLFAGCSNKLEDKEQVTINNGKVSEGIVVGKQLKDYTFKDQFGKEHSLTNKTKKVIFVFTKPTGHLVRSYLLDQSDDYLEKRDIDFIADVSGMPSLIFKMFALPDFQQSNYKVLLIKDKTQSAIFRDEKNKNAVMIISLDNKIVKDVKFVTNEKDLIKAID